MAISPELAAMLEQAFGRDRDDKPRKALVHPLAQAEALREAFRQVTAPGRLEPGTLCREKTMFAKIKDELRAVFMVLRPFDPIGNSFDRAVMEQALREDELKFLGFMPDVVCMNVFASAGRFPFNMLHYSGTLEPVSDADLAAWPLPVEPE